MNFITLKLIDVMVRVYGISRDEIIAEAKRQNAIDGDGNVSISRVGFSGYSFCLKP